MPYRPALALALLCAAFASAGDLLPVFTFDQPDGDQTVTYFVPRIADDAITIDGKLDDAAWSGALHIGELPDVLGEQPQTDVKVAYDREFIYFGFECAAEPTLRATAAAGERDADIWGDHCIDIKIATGMGDVQFLVNANGAWSDGLKRDLTWNPQVDVAAARQGNAWTVELRVKAGSLWLPHDFDGRYLPIALGRANPDELLQSLSQPYGRTDKAPRFVFGDEAAYRKARDGATFTRASTLTLITDREQYPRFCERSLGRLRIRPGNGDPLNGRLGIIMAVMSGAREVAAQTIQNIDADLADFELDLTQIPEGEYTLEARLLDGEDVLAQQSRPLIIRNEPRQTAGQIDLRVPAGPVDLPAYGYTFGVPMPWGALTSTDHLRLTDASGREVPMQVEVTSRWSRNGHVRWLLIDAVLPMRTEAQQLTLTYGPTVSRAAIDAPLTLTDSDAQIAIDTGPAQLTLSRSDGAGIASLVCESDVIRPHRDAGPYMIDQDGKVYRGINDPNPQVVVEAAGPIKAQVSVSGWHVSESGEKLGRFILRYIAYRGLPTVRMDHTFIITAGKETQYHDIGYTLAVQAEHGFFGSPRITPYKLNSYEDSAYLIQLDDLHGKIYANGKFEEEFARAEGWINAGGLTVTVRDFWQNFPKEFEARADRLLLHFWPGHGETPLRTGDRLSERNAYQHWFAQEGKLLDFRVPDEYLAMIDSDEYREHATIASPVGLSKTHQVMLQPASWNWEQSRARSVAEAFQSDPTVTCDPAWICDSKVFGDIAPRDMQTQGELETTTTGTMRAIARHNELDRDYGMWCFGDSHHNWIWHERRIRLYRTWRQTHHHWPRWPWLQYARSGDKETFNYARRNGRNVVDVAHAHHTNDELADAPWPRGKLVGGICDYKGFVKWSAGNRLGYNSVADAMLHQYYFTGDRRARDTAVEHVNRILEDNNARTSREGSARIVSLVAYYMHTWDNAALDLLERHVDGYVAQQEPSGLIADRPVLSFWTPAFIRYTDLTRAEKGRLLTTRWADLILVTDPQKRLWEHQQLIDSPLSSILASLSQAYVYTGDEKYLRMAKTRAKQFYDVTYQGEDVRYRGQTGGWSRNLAWSWYLTDMPYYVYAMNQHGGDVEPMGLPREHQIASLQRQTIDDKTWWTFHARIAQATDRPFEIHLPLRPYGHIAELVPLSGGKRIVAEATHNEGDKHEYIHLKVPADGAREYAFRLRTTQRYMLITLPIAKGADDLKEVYPWDVDGQPLYIGGNEWFWFDLPEGARELSFQMNARSISEAQVRDAAGKVAMQDTWIASNGSPRLTVAIAGSRRGWSLRFRGDDGGKDRASVNQAHIEPTTAQRPLYFAVSPDKFFWPTRDTVDW